MLSFDRKMKNIPDESKKKKKSTLISHHSSPQFITKSAQGHFSYAVVEHVEGLAMILVHLLNKHMRIQVK